MKIPPILILNLSQQLQITFGIETDPNPSNFSLDPRIYQAKILLMKEPKLDFRIERMNLNLKVTISLQNLRPVCSRIIFMMKVIESNLIDRASILCQLLYCDILLVFVKVLDFMLFEVTSLVKGKGRGLDKVLWGLIVLLCGQSAFVDCVNEPYDEGD